MPSQVELLTRNHDLSHFQCGNPVLDRWLKKWALANLAGDAARTYVIHENGAVIGYYTLCTGSVRREDAPDRVARGQANHPIPIILLARLAVDKRAQGQGLGAALLKDALLRIEEAADIVGARAVVVDAIDENVRNFYLHFGFEDSPIDEYRLMLLMKDLRKSLRS